MKRVKISTGSTEQFFRRGRKIAKLADRRKSIPESFSISFEDPADMLALLTPKRVEVLDFLLENPASITQLAHAVKRDRSAVKRDIDALASAGLVRLRDAILPGHGRQKIVQAEAKRITLTATIG
jgi:predicted transcriptional regulator